MSRFTPRFSCELLKWDVRLLISLDILQGEYHRNGFFGPVEMDAFNWVENFILNDLCHRGFREAMERYRIIQSKHMDGSSRFDFCVSCILDGLMKKAFPTCQPEFYSPLDSWQDFKLQFAEVLGGFHNHGVIDFHCKDKSDAFDQLLSCCMMVPDDDVTKQWVVEQLHCGSIVFTDEFYDWALPVLPDFMVRYHTAVKIPKRFTIIEDASDFDKWMVNPVSLMSRGLNLYNKDTCSGRNQ